MGYFGPIRPFLKADAPHPVAAPPVRRSAPPDPRRPKGVENLTALTELTRHGCDQAQGYFLSRPVPAAELEHWLDTPTRQPQG